MTYKALNLSLGYNSHSKPSFVGFAVQLPFVGMNIWWWVYLRQQFSFEFIRGQDKLIIEYLQFISSFSQFLLIFSNIHIYIVFNVDMNMYDDGGTY